MVEVLRCSDSQKNELLKLYNITKEELQALTERTKEWMKSQPHFPDIPDDVVIEKFILLNKLSFEKVKEKLTTYYVAKTLMPEFFCQDPNSQKLMKVMDVCFMLPLPNLTADLNRITVFKIIDDDVDKFDALSFLAFNVNVIEIRAREDYKYQDIQVYDLTGTKFGHIAKYTPTMLKRFSFILKKLFDNNVIGVHFLNMPSFMESFLNILRTFMSNKIEQRIIIHKNLESLYAAVGKENLPAEFGGSAGSLAEIKELWKKKFQESDAIFKRVQSVKVNMDLLPDNLKIDDNFGVHGNFRKLDVD